MPSCVEVVSLLSVATPHISFFLIVEAAENAESDSVFSAVELVQQHQRGGYQA